MLVMRSRALTSVQESASALNGEIKDVADFAQKVREDTADRAYRPDAMIILNVKSIRPVEQQRTIQLQMMQPRLMTQQPQTIQQQTIRQQMTQQQMKVKQLHHVNVRLMQTAETGAAKRSRAEDTTRTHATVVNVQALMYMLLMTLVTRDAAGPIFVQAEFV